MVKQLVVHDSVSNTCELSELTPYPAVVAGANTTVTSVVAPNGKATYTVAVANAPVITPDTVVQNPNGTITHTSVDGTVFIVPLDRTNADITQLTAAGYGLSRGQWDKPPGRAALFSEVTDPNAVAAEWNIRALQRVVTNRAIASEDAAGARGVTNTDGTNGFYHRLRLQPGATLVLDDNGAMENLGGTDPIVTIPELPRYNGQILAIRNGQFIPPFTAKIIQAPPGGSIIGKGRDPVTLDIRVDSWQQILLYPWEMVTLVGDNLAWDVESTTVSPSKPAPGGASNYLHSSHSNVPTPTNPALINWAYELDGTVTIWGALPVNTAAFPAFTIFPEIIVRDIANGTYMGRGGRI